MHVIPEKLCDLAQACLDASQDVGDAWTTAEGTMEISSAAAGNVSSGYDLVAAHADVAAAAATAMGRLAAVLEHDMDGLYQCAFDFSCTDEAEGETYKSKVPFIPGLFGAV
ncbi:MAG: hypothetical protein M3237_05340 [Actinomycetota bacterium]|nr:hypothetical protein [Actinomycetota bacterium]